MVRADGEFGFTTSRASNVWLFYVILTTLASHSFLFCDAGHEQSDADTTTRTDVRVVESY